MGNVDPVALTAAHVAVESQLIMMRDNALFMQPSANGFVVNDKDGSPNCIMRMGTRMGLEIAIKAYLDALENGTTIEEIREKYDSYAERND